MVKVRRGVIMGVDVEILEFEGGTETVEKASQQSGEPISRIVKTLLLKAGDEYVVVIARGDRRVNLDALGRFLDKPVAMARAREVRQVLGVDVGAVTPLSEAVRRLRVIMDPSILENEYVLCGGGAKNVLIKVRVKDLVSLLNPEMLDAFI
ncbi:aminoacyl-tRNA deacylase [Vulcanisaeta thermophila]|uniref:aminoacyl-tRNA deacylase n=1 Tax=Vulcanisaeta thermophila TaxID=867917 RepID=UPI0008534D63|nr:YbaK/EbsC family protein [Vulcanisaeta thermophila]